MQVPSLGIPEEGHGNLVQYSCLEIPMNRGAWWATVHRVAKSWTWLKLVSIVLYDVDRGVFMEPMQGKLDVPWSHRPIDQMGKLRPGKAKDLLWATVAQGEDWSLEPRSADSQMAFLLCCLSLCVCVQASGIRGGLRAGLFTEVTVRGSIYPPFLPSFT